LVLDMGKLVITIPDELEQEFRDAVYRRYGMKRGNLTRAVIEALEQWISTVREEIEHQKDSKLNVGRG